MPQVVHTLKSNCCVEDVTEPHEQGQGGDYIVGDIGILGVQIRHNHGSKSSQERET